MKKNYWWIIIIPMVLCIIAWVNTGKPAEQETLTTGSSDLFLSQDEQLGTISVFRKGSKEPVLVQHAEEGFRPYLHPLGAPDGKGVLTEYSPAHHKHQTGIYWGFTRVNGRDFFHNPGNDYWKKVSAYITEKEGSEVKWQTVYDLLDEKGNAILTETQKWSMRNDSGRFVISLEWRGEAKTDITIGEYDYGGLFIRMPWKEGIKGEVVNSARQRNGHAEGQRATWVDVGMQVQGRDNLAHIAVFDHPGNKGYPQPWRVDSQMGIGPARSREGDWQIKSGETEVIRHQLVVYTGDLNDVKLNEQWVAFSGNENPLYAGAEMWKIAQQEGLEAKFLAPEEAVKAMTVKDGYKVNAWAAEPLMTQPMAFCWDDRGRMWIAENRDYESRGQGFSNSGDSRILILEDTDHDGVADTRKVFMEGLAFPAAIAVGFDGVFIGAPPNLLFVPDRNHDDVADIEDIEVRLTGWGIRDRHETLNSLHWGPDGWLYGCQGFATPSKVRKPEGKGRLYKHKDPFPENILEGEGTDINGGVWRYHPTKDKFEVVAHGFSNPWGIDYDAKGQLFISACVIPHMWHVIPGGIYHRQGGRHFNPFVYDDIKTITDHSHRSAHGGARIYQSDAFPASQKGRIFMANIHEHAVLSDILKPQGSGFVASHGDDFMMANNAQWVGFSMEIGPDGGVYVLDWHDADICGQKVLNAETGRIFRIVPEQSGAENWPGRYSDLTKMSDKELAALQTSKSDWHARRARVILQGRAARGETDQQAHRVLLEIFQSNPDTDFRLKAMWALHVTKGLSGDMLLKALDDKEPYIRAWAIQLLCEDRSVSSKVADQFIAMAAGDRSPVVRLYLASAMQRLEKTISWSIAGELVKHAEDISDHNLPKMIWYGLEPMFKEDPARALKIVSESNIPLVASYTARRAVDGGKMNELVTTIGTRPKTLVSLLEGMRNGMEDRTDIKPPPAWQQVFATLKKRNDKAGQLALQVAALFGDTEATQRSLATLKNKHLEPGQRKKALQALTAQQRKELLPELPALLEEPQLRIEVIKSIAAFDEQLLGSLLIKKYKGFNEAEKSAAVQTLSSRPVYGWILSQALKENIVPKRDVSANVARQLRRVVGSGFVEIWGPIDDSPRDDKAYTRYKNLLSGQAAKNPDVNNGRQLFMRTCGSCHKMYGQGGEIGPELTGSNRSNVDYLLFNILNPSEEIQDDYKMVVVTTRDGRTYSGNLVGENQRQVTMRVVGQNDVVINKSSIQSKEVTPVSMMPQGLLNTLTDKETIDLLSYLQKAGK
ncbi:PVC-type heme-binding CxxCH protein [Agriterribacter sp.]|uniref:PVC-type heme-binding CxxCH protein n=1 Tax=Agriterribacter sp. TaxID=2821509 RepID=UPI002C689438|nr:PVC-type heme-binding CxxCH protein [Agriterribacter sp.]HTN07861.1 PVC-type heme-binding CxxCH protein [Agriterribacter sp.]